MTAKEESKDEGARNFSVLLSQIDDGRLHDELSETVQKMVDELSTYTERYARDGKGSITLTLSLVARANGTTSVVGDVKTKTPKPIRAGTVFWKTKGNNLSLDNPRQQKLALREVPAAKPARDLEPNARPTKTI